MKAIFIDTETNGVPKNYKAPYTDTANWPEPIQVAYTVATISPRIKPHHSTVVVLNRPDIEPHLWSADAFSVHGISYEDSLISPVGREEFYQRFISDLMKCDLVIAHNIDFDWPVILADLTRMGCDIPNMRTLCTMKEPAVIRFCNLPGPYGPKWPKLEELYERLFGKPMSEKFRAHDAMEDVKATVNCFAGLINKKIISIPN